MWGKPAQLPTAPFSASPPGRHPPGGTAICRQRQSSSAAFRIGGNQDTPREITAGGGRPQKALHAAMAARCLRAAGGVDQPVSIGSHAPTCPSAPRTPQDRRSPATEGCRLRHSRERLVPVHRGLAPWYRTGICPASGDPKRGLATLRFKAIPQRRTHSWRLRRSDPRMAATQHRTSRMRSARGTFRAWRRPGRAQPSPRWP